VVAGALLGLTCLSGGTALAQRPARDGALADRAAAASSGQEAGTRLRVETRYEIRPTPDVKLSSLPFHAMVARASERYRLDPALIHAVIMVESQHDPNALSPKGALGLMQLMPETAARYGVRDRRDPAESIRGGTAYLRDLVDLFKGDVELAIAAYNAGEKAVMNYGNKIPPFLETVFYVPRVLDEFRKLKGIREYLPAGTRIQRTPQGRLVMTIPATDNATRSLIPRDTPATPDRRL
jgi:soluble lytic murein transglycosylase-like protein